MFLCPDPWCIGAAFVSGLDSDQVGALVIHVQFFMLPKLHYKTSLVMAEREMKTFEDIEGISNSEVYAVKILLKYYGISKKYYRRIF